MSEKSNFGSGFLLGTIIGGMVGGAIGAIITKKTSELSNNNSEQKLDNDYTVNHRNIENSRLSLEDKINQLNLAIDDVRITLQENADLPKTEGADS